MRYIEIAKKQLDRDGKVLIKADLIAILILLNPELSANVEILQKSSTIEDLNIMIRTIIYDPSTYQRLLTNNNNNNNINNNNINNNNVQSINYDNHDINNANYGNYVINDNAIVPAKPNTKYLALK